MLGFWRRLSRIWSLRLGSWAFGSLGGRLENAELGERIPVMRWPFRDGVSALTPPLFRIHATAEVPYILYIKEKATVGVA